MASPASFSLAMSARGCGGLRLRHPVVVACGEARLSSDLPHWLGSFSLPFRRRTIAAVFVSAALAFVTGAPLMRLSGYFVSVATRRFLIVVNVILINANRFTRGARPSSVPRETRCHGRLAGWPSRSLCFRVSSIRLTVGDTGRSGKIRSRQKRSAYPCCRQAAAFMVGAFFAGVGGSLYGHYLGSFSPASFYMAYTFSLISMLVIGGMQNIRRRGGGCDCGHAGQRGAARS